MVPGAIATAGQEQLVANSSHDAIAGTLPEVRHITITGAKHEILMERDQVRTEFWRAFDEMADHVAPVSVTQ